VRNIVAQECRESRRRLSEKQFKLGRAVARRQGIGVHSQVVSAWEEGQEFRDLRKELAELQSRKEDLDRRRKEIAKMGRALRGKSASKGSKSKPVSSSSSSSNAVAGGGLEPDAGTNLSQGLGEANNSPFAG